MENKRGGVILLGPYDVRTMLLLSNFSNAILNVAHSLQDDEQYTKEDAKNDLLAILEYTDSAVIIYDRERR